MNALLQQASARWAALNMRERWMVFFAGLAVVYVLLNSVFLGPLQRQQQQAQTDIAQSAMQLTEIKQQIATLAQQPVVSVDTSNMQKIAQINAQINAQQAEMTALQDTLVSPAQMPGLLKDLIEHHAGLRLIDMKTLPPENFLSAQAGTAPAAAINTAGSPLAASAQAEQPLIYRHAITMTLAGNYMALMRYAQALQGMSAQVLWDKAELAAKTYPENELTITVYTLSLDATWLSI